MVVIFLIIMALTGLERLIELNVANRNRKWSIEQGGQEVGQGHYPFMVVLHTGFLICCVAEALLMEREFIPWLGYPMIGLAVACQVLRWWCINTLGKQWNTRVIIVPGLSRIDKGPYRFIPHPNYVAVALEGIALPLIMNAYWTAIGFTVLNAALMSVRIKTENNAISLTEKPLNLRIRYTCSQCSN